MTLTPEAATIIATALGGISGATIAMCKLIWALAKLRAWRRARTEADRKSLSDINPGFALPFAVLGAGALAALLAGGPELLAAALAKPRPSVPCKCPGDCLGPTCSCDGSCKCEGCGARPPSAPRPRVSAHDRVAAVRYAGKPTLAGAIFPRRP